MRPAMKIQILGARGSVPTDGKDMMEFGGATSCVMVETDKSVIFLDAGTGIISAPDSPGKDAYVFITHPHADHLIGLPFFPYLFMDNRKIEIFANEREGLGAYDQIAKLMSEPLWPCTIMDYPAETVCTDVSFPLDLGDVKILGIGSNHPGGSSVLKLEADGASVVYATDYEHSDENDEELASFCAGADLLLFDGQYTPEEYAQKTGYGHSTPQKGVEIMKKSGVKMLRIVHHDPFHNDLYLREMEAAIKTDNIAFARQGEVIWLQR